MTLLCWQSTFLLPLRLFVYCRLTEFSCLSLVLFCLFCSPFSAFSSTLALSVHGWFPLLSVFYFLVSFIFSSLFSSFLSPVFSLLDLLDLASSFSHALHSLPQRLGSAFVLFLGIFPGHASLHLAFAPVSSSLRRLCFTFAPLLVPFSLPNCYSSCS